MSRSRRTSNFTRAAGAYRKNEILTELTRGLAETQKDKFTSLAEAVEFKTEESYRDKLVQIKESYFGAPKVETTEEVSTEEPATTQETVSESMSRMSLPLLSVSESPQTHTQLTENKMFNTEQLQRSEPVLKHDGLPEIKDNYRKAVTAQLLENQERFMREERQVMTGSTNAGPINTPTTGAGANFGFDPILISLIRRAMPRWLLMTSLAFNR